MTEAESYDSLTSSIAVLADPGDESGRIPVSGVAIGEEDETTGMSGVKTVWPAETLQSAAGMLEGAPITKQVADDEHHPGARKTDDGLEVDPQPPVDSVIGKVTNDEYVPGTGLVWEGYLTDETVAGQVEADLVEVSPVVARETEARGDGSDVHEATAIHGFRDLTVVTRGAAPSNSIEPGTAAAMSADEIATLASDTFGHPNRDDDPAEASTGGDATNSGDTMDIDELTDTQKSLLRQAEDLDNPTVVAEEQTDLLEDAAGLDDPTVVEADDYAALEDETKEVRMLYAEALAEKWGTDAEKIADRFELEALREEFETEDGDLDTEALVQSPRSGEPSDDPDDDPEGVDALSDEDREALQEAKQRYEYWEGKNDTIAQTERETMTDLLGVDDFEDVDMEAL